MPLLLVRHAHALGRSSWDEDDSLRPLSDRGRRQAKGLVPLLAGYQPSRILSSRSVRCVDTVQPLALALGLKVEQEDGLAEGSGPEAVELVLELGGTEAALCSHGDVIPLVLDALDRRFDLGLGRAPRNEKASVWVLEWRKSKPVRARYIRPPS